MRLKLENTLKNCHQVGEIGLSASREASSYFLFSRRFFHSHNELSSEANRNPILFSVLLPGAHLMSHSWVSRSSWSWRSSGWRCCATFWPDTTSRCPASVKRWTMWDVWQRAWLDPGTDCNSVHYCVLRVPGPQADRAGRPEGGHGQRCSSPGARKQHHLRRPQSRVPHDWLLCEYTFSGRLQSFTQRAGFRWHLRSTCFEIPHEKTHNMSRDKVFVNSGGGQQIADGQRPKKRGYQSQTPSSGRLDHKNQERPGGSVQLQNFLCHNFLLIQSWVWPCVVFEITFMVQRCC